MSAANSAARRLDDDHGRLTLQKAYETYYHQWSPDLSSGSNGRHLGDLRRWIRYMGDTAVADLTTELYQRFRSLSSKSGMAPGTCETTLRTVFQIVRVCHAFRLIRIVPDRGKPRRVVEPTPRVLTESEINSLYLATENRGWPHTHVPAPLWWKCVLALGCWTGFRREDLLWRLSWHHVLLDSEIPRIEFHASKTGKRHVIPLVPPIVAHLRALRAPLAEVRGPLFNTPRNQRDLRNTCRMLSKDAGVHPKFTIKHMRSTAIGLWRDADSHAGCILHGVGLPRIMHHYLDQAKILEHAMWGVTVPTAIAGFTEPPTERQLTLW